MSVFLDSGIFIAFLNRRDRWHFQAKALFNQPRPPKWATSVLVLSETYSWFLHRMGEEPARSFRLFLENLTGLTLLEATLEHHHRALKMLDRFRGSKLTYVDASSLVWIAERKIACVWSTDHHLGLTGVEVLPREA
ncbi:MAG: PIN domain-containing protein [Deltaproteobacteria bacterium]|nr:PIN domain-containing protein [Deltaproteobacteria bacterium]